MKQLLQLIANFAAVGRLNKCNLKISSKPYYSKIDYKIRKCCKKLLIRFSKACVVNAIIRGPVLLLFLFCLLVVFFLFCFVLFFFFVLFCFVFFFLFCFFVFCFVFVFVLLLPSIKVMLGPTEISDPRIEVY